MAELEGRIITELPTATTLSDGDYFVVFQNAQTKKVPAGNNSPDTGWIVHPEFNYLKFRKVGHVVFFKMVSNNDVYLTPEGTALCYMPVGYRPEEQTDIAWTAAGGTGAVFMRVDPDGLVSGFANPGTTYCSGSGSFPV